MALKGPKIDSNLCFCIFHHFHQFLAQFGSIFWRELFQYLAFDISWHQFDIPSYPTYPQKLFCSHSNSLKSPRIYFEFWENLNSLKMARITLNLNYLTFLAMLTSFNFGWGVLRWVAWTIWSDACLLDQITYVILYMKYFKIL